MDDVITISDDEPINTLSSQAAAPPAIDDVITISDDDDSPVSYIPAPPNDPLAELRPLLDRTNFSRFNGRWSFRVGSTACDCELHSGGLTVADVCPNPDSLPGTPLLERFAAALARAGDRRVALAFHGTPLENLSPICAYGLDPARRRGQSYGPGEYFATHAGTSLSFCQRSSRTVVLFALLLDPSGLTHNDGHTIVVHAGDHQLPLATVTFA